MIDRRLFILAALSQLGIPAAGAYDNDRNASGRPVVPYQPRWQEGGPEGGPDRPDSPPDRPDPPSPPSPPDKPDNPDKPDHGHGDNGEGGEGGEGSY